MNKHPNHDLHGPVTYAAKATAFLSHLLRLSILDQPALQRVVSAMTSSSQSVETVLLELGLIEEVRLADEFAAFLGLQRMPASGFPEELPTGDLIPLDYLQRMAVLPVQLDDRQITLALSRPLDDDAARAIGYILDRRVQIHVATVSEINRHLTALVTAGSTEFAGFQADDSYVAEDDAERLRDIASEAPVVRLLNRIIATALDRSASDIHIEPGEDSVVVRYRVDGALLPVETLDRSLQLALASRVKILARLNIAEHRLPQDGRIRIAIRGRDIDLRVSTSPTFHGESIVLRILDRHEIALDFAALGFSESARQQMQRLFDQPNGIVLVTGPTGSGKTTTLYAGLSQLNQPRYKVCTVEDPIEYHLKGANQILVRPGIGLDFAAVLRSVLRQDPDIIMVGEIRDSETARIAVQASLTGHMVLSTLHTNSAAASITRLRDIGIDDFLIVSSLRAIVAQRLVRKLCENCKSPCAPPPVCKVQIGDNFHAACGCNACHGTGYRGRTAIHETLELSGNVKTAILARRPDAELERIARSEGMSSLYESGLAKARDGTTTWSEVQRAVQALAE